MVENILIYTFGPPAAFLTFLCCVHLFCRRTVQRHDDEAHMVANAEMQRHITIITHNGIETEI